jgi:hypothetical protein
MDHEEFREILSHLRLGHASRLTAERSGLSVRQLQRISTGEAPVPGPVQCVLGLLLLNHTGELPDPQAGLALFRGRAALAAQFAAMKHGLTGTPG